MNSTRFEFPHRETIVSGHIPPDEKNAVQVSLKCGCDHLVVCMDRDVALRLADAILSRLGWIKNDQRREKYGDVPRIP